jgi:hypothetical protein
MTRADLRRLTREWAALIAALVFVLAPLALGVTRSLGVSDKIAIAAGLAPPALCGPAAPDGGSGSPPDCDHCVGPQSFALAVPSAATGPALRSIAAAPVPVVRRAATFARAPPARGPPAA